MISLRSPLTLTNTGTPQRANLYKWCSFVSSSVDDIVIPLNLHKVRFSPQIRNTKLVEENNLKFEQQLAPVLVTGVKNQPYFGGQEVWRCRDK